MHRAPGLMTRAASLTIGLLSLAAAALAQAPPPMPGEAAAGIGEVKLFGEEDLKIEAATKTQVPVSKAPGAVSVITARQIRESGARTIPDLLRLVPGVNVRWNPMVETIDVRGFGENPFTNRVLLLIDGLPYNDWNQGGFPQHPGLDFFVLQNVKRIEVVKGPGSSLYGENAYWGVINIVTLSGEDLQGGRVEAFGGGERGTASGGALYGRTLGEKSEGSFLASVKYLRSELPMEFWEDDGAKWRGSDIFLKANWKGLQASYYRHRDTMDGFSETIPLGPGVAGVFRSAPEVGQTVDIAAGKYDWAASSKDLTVSANASYARRFGTHCAACHAATEKPSFGIEEDHGYQLIGDFRVGFQKIPGHDILLGVEGRHVDRGEHAHELVQGSEVVGTYNKLAAYIQDQLSFMEDRLRVTAGVRYDAKTDLFEDKFSPRVAVVYNPTDPLVLRAGYGTAFRFPNFSEIGQSSWFINVEGVAPVAIPLASFRPNLQLQPEEIRTLDAGAEYRFSPQLSAKVDLYRSELEQFVVMTVAAPPPPDLATLGFENHRGEAVVKGLEGELRWNPTPAATLFGNYAYETTDQTDAARALDSTGKPIEFVYAPTHKVNLGVFLGPFSGVRGSAELSWKSSYTAPSFWGFIASEQDPTKFFTQPELDGYTLLDARVSWDLPVAVGKVERPFRLTLHGRNLLDRRPKETLIGVDTTLTGREVFAEVSFEFR